MSGTSLSKSVSLRIVANAGTAKETLDNIAAKADDINGKKSSLTVGVRTGDTKAQLDEITAKAHALGITNVKFSVKADTKTADKNIDESTHKVRGFALALAGASSSAIGFGDAAVLASGDSSMFQKVMAGLSLGTGLLEPALAGLVVVAGGVGAGLLAAGVGAGVFGLVLKGNLKVVEDATKAHKQLKGALGEEQRTLNHAKTEWSRFISGNAQGVASVLVPALHLLPAALGLAQQFMQPIESALKDIIANVKTAMDSPFWKSTIASWAVTSGPALEEVATAIGHIIHGLAGVVTAFMPMSTNMLSTVDNLTAKFAKWGETLGNGKHSGFESLISMARTEGPMAAKVLGNLATALINVGKSMTGMDGIGNSKTLLQILMPLSSVLASLSKNQGLDRIALYLLTAYGAGKKLKGALDGVKSAATNIGSGAKGVSNLVRGFRDADTAASATSGIMGTFGGKLSKITKGIKDFGAGSKIASAATKIWTGIQAAFDVVMSANPIGLVVIAIAALIAIIVLCAIHFKSFRDFWKAAWKDMQNWAHNVISFLHSDWSAFVNTFTSLGHRIESAWNATVNFIRRVASSAIRAVVSFFRGLPGKVGSALRNLGSMLLSIGRNAMLGLLHGIEGVAGRIVGYAENIASKISGAFSKVLGIFSPSRVFMQHGKNIALGLIQGMSGMEGTVAGSANNLGHAVTRGFNVQAPRTSGASRAAGGNTFNINVTGIVGDAGATGRQIVQSINTYLRQTGQTGLSVV